MSYDELTQPLAVLPPELLSGLNLAGGGELGTVIISETTTTKFRPDLDGGSSIAMILQRRDLLFTPRASRAAGPSSRSGIPRSPGQACYIRTHRGDAAR